MSAVTQTFHTFAIIFKECMTDISGKLNAKKDIAEAAEYFFILLLYNTRFLYIELNITRK